MNQDNCMESFANKLELDGRSVLLYNQLPAKTGRCKLIRGMIDGKTCYIFRKSASRAALFLLMQLHPEACCFEAYSSYAPSILEMCFMKHGRIFPFVCKSEGEYREMIAITDEPLWEDYQKDFLYTIDFINYVVDYNESGGAVFMDDYGLC